MKQTENVGELFSRYAESYQESFMNLTLYDDTYDAFCSLIEKEKPHIFEIGCGPGNITRYLLSRRPDFRIKATDLASGMIDLARKNVPEAVFSELDCRDLDLLNTHFDGIICGFCIPYLSEESCRKLIVDCARLLNKDGIAYFSLIEDDYEKSGFKPTSDGKSGCPIYYYKEQQLQEWLAESGFKTAFVRRKQFERPSDGISVHLILIVKKTD